MSRLTELMKSILSGNGELDDSTAEFLSAVAAHNTHIPLNGAQVLKAALAGGTGTINNADGRRE